MESDRHALGGLATRRQVRVLLEGTEGGPGFDLLLYVPNAATHPVPAFLGLNFGGNHSVHPDPAISLPGSWMRGAWGCEPPGYGPGRRAEAAAWPIEHILNRGYAVATVYYGDIEPDRPDGWKKAVR